jgi:hypothetical protein
MSTDGALDPSPFDDDDGPSTGRSGAPRPWEAALPLTQEELDRYTTLPFVARTFNPWHCMWNNNAEDGIGYYSGLGKRQCETVLADPTKARYCMDHAQKMGVDFYAPGELSEAADKEAATNLTRLVPKAIKTLEMVMDDEDAPAGIRAKSADSILDRTGYAKGVDVRVDARIATVDITSVIQDRLDALRDAQLKKLDALREDAAAAAAEETVDETPVSAVVPGEIVATVELDDDREPGAPGSRD